MTTIEPRLEVQDWATDFDILDADYVADPAPVWADLRERCPMAHTERYGSTWLPTRYDDLEPEDALDRLLEETALVADQDSYEGDADAVEAMVDWCREGPGPARVQRVARRDGAVTGARAFEVRY